MSNLIQTLAFTLPIIATLCVLSVVSVNIYLRIRRRFPINVNCWFCNEWTKVHYDNYNSFYCPKCSQYNGFNEEGGYNKVLSEQHDELLNQQVPLIQKNSGFKLSNGLCHICNNNQKLKIYQLANFVPLNDDTFDVEVEHFQKQLEKAYKLCARCDGTVRKVLSKQNRWLLGAKINTLKTKGLSLLDLNKSSSSLSKKSKRSIFLRFLNLMLILFASLIFLFTVCNVNFMPDNFKHTANYIISYNYPMFTIFNNSRRLAFANGFHEYLNISIASISQHVPNPSAFFENLLDGNTFSNLTENIDAALSKSLLVLPKPDVHMLCVTGLFFQTTSLFFAERITFQNVKLCFLWCCLLAMTRTEYFGLDPTVTLSLQIVISFYIVYNFFKKDVRKNETDKIKMIYKKKRFINMLAENKSSYHNNSTDNEDDFINDHSTTEVTSVFNSTFKPKTTYNETDTATSDCSFGSLISRYTSIHNPFKEPLPRVRSPLASNQRDHTFGKPPNFVYTLTPSPAFFVKPNSSNSIFNESHLFSNNLNKNGTSFGQLNGRCKHEPLQPFTTSNQSSTLNFDLNESLHNLHLDRNCYDIKAPKKVPITVLKNNTPRPILSPPKLTCVSRNSWLPVNDGFWSNVKDINYERANISSNSSQSSGFASQSNDFPDTKLYSSVFRKQTAFPDNGSRLFKQNCHLYRSQDVWKLDQKEAPTLDHIFKPIQSSKIYNSDMIS